MYKIFKALLAVWLLGNPVQADSHEVEHRFNVDVSESMFFSIAAPDSMSRSQGDKPTRRIDLTNLTMSELFSRWPVGYQVEVYEYDTTTRWVGYSPQKLSKIFSDRYANTEYREAGTNHTQTIEGRSYCLHVAQLTDGVDHLYMENNKTALEKLLPHGYATIAVMPHPTQAKEAEKWRKLINDFPPERYSVMEMTADPVANTTQLLARVARVESLGVSCDREGL